VTLGGRHISLWLDDGLLTSYPTLQETHRCDVAVVGGGITGLTVALLLAREGRSVAVLDQGPIGTGVSGHTTAKVTSQHGATYLRLRLTLGQRAAETYGQANEAAKERIAAFVEEGISCDFRRRPAYLYASSRLQRILVEREATAAAEAGLPAAFVEDVPLPFETHGAARFDGQAEFHPYKYVVGLARLLEETGGRLFERARAIHVHEESPCRIETESGEVLAEHVVVATLLPFLDRGLFFARAFPSRSYLISARIEEQPPGGMFINVGSPTRSLRAHPHAEGELLLVGGEGHHVGSDAAQPERYERLIEFACEHWSVKAIEHRWSAQDYSPDDGVPYIGRLHVRSDRVYVATGLKKWGITGGTAAAMLISDAVLGRKNPWAKLFSSTRVRPLAEGPRFAWENAQVGFHFVGDRVRHRGTRTIHELEPGEGDIVNAAGKKVAGYRNEDGSLYAVSTRCTHLYCQVRWNRAERSWDCPCHGSRFSPDGQVIDGPAVRPLDRRPID
jgi:glycine/D-amino acid oxidase-like deaminating enzyme/nitrite reductase/ring-hydroxylating ferredoxin subunit